MPSFTPPTSAVPLPRSSLPRGVHQSNERQFGQYLFIAVSSQGYVIAQERPDSAADEDEIMTDLDALLDAVDPIAVARPTHLRLMTDGEPAEAGVSVHDAPPSSPCRSWRLSIAPRTRVGTGSRPGAPPRLR